MDGGICIPPTTWTHNAWITGTAPMKNPGTSIGRMSAPSPNVYAWPFVPAT